MNKVKIEELEKLGLNRYEAVIIASKYAHILNARRLRMLERIIEDPDTEVDPEKISLKVSMAALLELLDGKVKFTYPGSM
ncbi:MAG: hypothetical protein U9N55_01325 [candidate division Zixibacteria bacterium]|nr:hypothetical protein [candidate division Zixibacteria bacterium]